MTEIVSMITDYHAKYYAHELSIRHSSEGVDRLSQSLFDASISLHPYQIEAALFSLQNPLNQGVVLADEVGLGKTIEAGLVLCQFWAELKRKLLIVCPASLRRQWAQELQDKFNLPSIILDAQAWKRLNNSGVINPLAENKVVIMSYHYAVRLEQHLVSEPWDLVVFDEAHKLRNSHQKSNKMGQTLRRALKGRKKLLLTATPLQNSLMELYGLSTLIDEYLFGDAKAFRQQYVGSKGALPALKNRLNGFIKRTLRRQVLEYVRYTERRTLTVPFTPRDDEQALYDAVSVFLAREHSYALPKQQRHLTGLVLRKLLASSTSAVLNTLETILRRLELMRVEESELDANDQLATIVESDDLQTDYLEEFASNDDTESKQWIDQKKLEIEIAEVAQFVDMARAISTDSKAIALLQALSLGFKKLEETGATQKAIIFTESRRTQNYLVEYLSDNGYAGRLVTFSGTNNGADATRVYQRWREQHKGSDRVTGSVQVDRRTALIDYFRDDAEIMIATEAAAEGVNLQFCSLLINYDLPWNPQRVEQRIGRCHRYGQQYDVVVINFFNERNYADQRVLQLLTEKFQLFNGVFGASDEILGSIESGLDFEKRILQIYNTCRSSDAIESAFEELQQELESHIDEKLKATEQLLLENFDEDIHDLLKLRLDEAEQRLDKMSRWFWALTRHALDSKAMFDEQSHSFELNTDEITDAPRGDYQLIRFGSRESTVGPHAHTYRLTHPLGEWVLNSALKTELPCAQLTLNYEAYGAKVSVLEPLRGKAGTLTLQRYTIESLERTEDYLVFAAETETGEQLPSEVSQKLLLLPASHLDTTIVEPSTAMENALESRRNVIAKEVNDRNLQFFEQEINKLDDWSDDLKESLEQGIKDLDKEIRQVRREAKIAPLLEEKLVLQKQQRKLETQRNQQRRALFDRQDEVDAQRERLIEALEEKLNKKTNTETLFTIRWSII